MQTPETSSALVRSASDRRVLEAILDAGPMSRAGLAAHTGLSKPTASAAVARLVDAGLIAETGQSTHGRGRSATLLGLARRVESLSLTVDPSGITADVVAADGEVLRSAHSEATGDVSERLREMSHEVWAGDVWPHACVSVADPIDRHTGKAVQLPDEPFLIGELDPEAVLTDLAEHVHVDNDINWAVGGYAAAHPECQHAAVLFLGHGLGCGIVDNGQVLRGQHGLAGEIAHLWVPGVAGRAQPAIQVFDELEMREDSAIVPARVVAAAASDAHVRGTVSGVVNALIAALVGIADVGRVILAGPWADVIYSDVVAQVAASARPVDVVLAREGEAEASSGLRVTAANYAREHVLSQV